jgi:hypothetical protein
MVGIVNAKPFDLVLAGGSSRMCRVEEAGMMLGGV